MGNCCSCLQGEDDEAVVDLTPLPLLKCQNLKIAAFNIQIFGEGKAGKADVMDIIVKILCRYDIVLIQEIRDKGGTAIKQLLNQVNEISEYRYDMIISERLGRTKSKEQYAFFYKVNYGLSVLQEYQHPDDQDQFEREPFAVKFSFENSALSDFVLAAIHTDPDTAVEELNQLDDVYNDITTVMHTQNVMIMGDFNASGCYVNKKQLANLDLKTDNRFQWLIGDDADTTISKSDCAYDRFVVAGENLVRSVVTGSAGVFRFDTEYGLDEQQAKTVSDHYPIEVELSGANPSEE